MIRIILTLLIGINIACGPRPAIRQFTQPERAKDGQYDSEFPTEPIAKDLQRIVESVKLISLLTFYESYDFLEIDKITASNLGRQVFKTKSIRKYIFEKPSSGTATVIYAQDHKVALLTCAHILESPDTLFTFFRNEKGEQMKYIQNVSVIIKQLINIIQLPHGGEVEILATDRDMDLAIVGKRLTEMVKPNEVQVFDYAWGAASELQWGNFVYLIGYPYGKKMISTAVVSNPNRDRNHSFMIDATLHKGVSGGLILALRDGAPNFELVGIANALSAQSQLYLRPEKEYQVSEMEMQQPYLGDIYVDSQVSVVYGITYAISVESVRRFLKEKQKQLSESGYNYILN